MWFSRTRSALLLAIALAAPAAAQDVSRVALESAIGVDAFGGDNAVNRAQVVIDVSAAVRVGDRWQVYVRPWFRQARPSTTTVPTPPWDTELHQAGVRYERPGSIATRVDAGYILAPIGLGILDSRPNLNPTIVPHLAYAVPMPAFDTTGPRTTAVASTYPLGTQVTFSTLTWDTRAAVINAAPVRAYVVGASSNPAHTPVAVVGAGVTPTIGLRIGASFAQGLYATSGEITGPASGGRSVTMAGTEVEYAFGSTKISGEFLRSSFETSTVPAVAYEWFVQGTQTLSARWFLAGRQEGTSAPPRTAATVGARPDFEIFEATAGFRATPDITIRSSVVSRRPYDATGWDNQAGVSIVWARRWW
jgi:hypothetical protein